MGETKQRKTVTRDDVAALAGVSSATVSYVINDGPRPVSPKTRSKVLEAIRTLGYQPNSIARSLRRQQTFTLGLIIPDNLNPYFAEVARGVEAAAFEHGYTVVFGHSHYSVENENRYADVLRAERVAGVVWIPSTETYEPANKFTAHQIPIVVVDRVVEDQDAYSVVADNFHGGYLAAEHLIALGHQRIGFICRPQALAHSNERMRGYQAALAEHNLAPDESLIVPGGYKFEDGREAALTLLQSERPPTAIFAYNDIIAIGVLRAASELDLSVPNDLSVVGFDDIPGAAFTFPPLTTVSLPKFEMGQRSAELLIGLINGEEASAQSNEMMDVNLVVRESTGAAST